MVLILRSVVVRGVRVGGTLRLVKLAGSGGGGGSANAAHHANGMSRKI